MNKSIVFASMVIAKSALAASGQPVLNGSTTEFGENFPGCDFFKTTKDGTTSDDGLTYVVLHGASGVISASDLMGTNGAYSRTAAIKFDILPAASLAYAQVLNAPCPIDNTHVPVGRLRWSSSNN